MSHLHLTARVTAAAAVGVVLLAGGCSGDPSSAPTPSDASSAGPPSGPVSSSRPEVPRPDGLEADISQPLTGGGGGFMGPSAGQAPHPRHGAGGEGRAGRRTRLAGAGPP